MGQIVSSISEDLKNISYHIYNEDVALDVLLDMCKTKKVGIKDIFVSEITEQFIGYVATLSDKDYEQISSFIILASTLLEFKSSELLPRSTFEDFEYDELLESELFILRTEEYNMLREAAQKIQENEVLNRFYREPEYAANDYKIVITDYNLDKMISAFAHILEIQEIKEENKVPKTIMAERFSVSDQIKYVVSEIKKRKEVSFKSLFREDFSKIEIINTFLGVLELAKQQVISILSNNSMMDVSDIIIKFIDDEKNNLDEKELLKNVEEYS